MNQEIKAVVERLRDSTEEAQGHDFKFVADARVEDMQVLLAHLKAIQKDADRLKALRELCGYVEDGSCQTVKLYQDDATKDWFCDAGRKSMWSESFNGAIDQHFSAPVGE